MKSTLVNSVEEKISKQTYADAARQSIRPDNRSSQDIDEGFCNNSPNTTTTECSQTRAKTVYTRETCVQNVNVPPSPRVSMISTPQPMPVRITNRNDSREALNTLNSLNPRSINNNNASVSPRKTLLIDDSIINNVNLRGLKPNTQKHSKRGARVRGILNGISMYDMTAFSEVIFYVGGNDAAGQVDVWSTNW